MGNANPKPKPPPAPQPLAPKTPPPAPSPPRPSSSSIVGTMLATNISLRRAAITYSDLRFGERLGQGACGEVIKGEYHGTPIVIKKMLQNQISAANVALFANEIQLLSTLRHPNIILFIGASADAQENLCLVTEYMERGDLGSLLLDPTIALSWKDPLLRFVVDICRGMAYLHSQEPKYIHRDLKAANILVSANFQVAKIADFGFVRLLTDEALSLRGTPLWTAPEILRGDTYTEKADVYSFGIVLAEIETRKKPYHEHNVNRRAGAQRLMHDIAYKELRPTLSENAPSSIASIYQRCVLMDPDGRPGFDQLIVEFDSLVRRQVDASA
ncbi:TKL protein kinase [Saprolegnia parasitica CBS 223.65]|uniref:TKL protein kinase n=1 Tax=Saprolegnia parasitica (strain CBS 223.65) TaxID=695850 RepID=A0A067CFY4_SAPPC|nr:TKL protein kinase [Saprolegnia parasitica CBS 223.65]KDO28090.1 TKL protein kinase [Saprolegnia parasitica CBS 223.65]|eukprot:XP_012201234.1 TKL protein kinase [Saprolegnia parasitica CBS 223.65]